MSDNIQDFNDIARPITIPKDGYSNQRCQHPTVEVDDKLPKLTCRVCHEVLCPYWYLRQWAAQYRTNDYRIQEMADYERKVEERREKDRLRREKQKEKRENRRERREKHPPMDRKEISEQAKAMSIKLDEGGRGA